MIENPIVLAIPPGSIVRDANYVVSSDAAYLWRGIKTGGPTGGGGWDGASLATGCRHVSLARIHPKFLFSVRKKKKRDGGRREWKKNGRGRREDALGVWGKGWERKGEGGNDAIKTMASSGRRRRTESSVIVGRKIANNRGRGGWGGEIRSERVGKI